MEKETENNIGVAEAAWVEYLNKLRVEKMLNSIGVQQLNFDNAMKVFDQVLEDTAKTVGDGITAPRGGLKNVHGFLAEIMENGFENVDKLLVGKRATFTWVDNNGPEDLLQHGIGVQLKFYRTPSGCLEAIGEHLEKYPYFLNRGKYMIPRDMHERILYYLSISEEQANKMPTKGWSFLLSLD